MMLREDHAAYERAAEMVLGHRGHDKGPNHQPAQDAPTSQLAFSRKLHAIVSRAVEEMHVVRLAAFWIRDVAAPGPCAKTRVLGLSKKELRALLRKEKGAEAPFISGIGGV